MFDRELLNKKYYSNLNIYGSELFLTSKFADKNVCLSSPFLFVENKRFILECLRKPYFLKGSDFSIKIRDCSRKYYHPLVGDYFGTDVLVYNISKKELLLSIQKYMDLYYRKWIKLAAFT